MTPVAPSPARSSVGEVPAFYPLAATYPLATASVPGSPQAPLTRGAAAQCMKTPEAPVRAAADAANATTPKRQRPTPGSTGHSAKRARRSPVYMRGVLFPRTLQFDPEPAASPPAQPRKGSEEWVVDAVPLIQGMREAEFYRAEFEAPEPFGSVLSILPFCDTTA